MSFRQIQVLGHVGSDPEIRKLPNGAIVANLSIATTDKFKSGGESKEKTLWWRVDIFQTAERGLVTEVVQKFVFKGSQIFVFGSPELEEWTDKTTGQKRNGFKIRVGHPGTGIQLCGRPNGKSNGVETDKAGEEVAGPGPSGGNAADEEIPF